MKKLFLLSLVLVFISEGCNKEQPAPQTSMPVPPSQTPPPPPPQTPPQTPVSIVSAVSNERYIAHPADSCLLMSYPHSGGIVSYRWRKVAGPASFRIWDSTSSKTKVDKLQVGDYEFKVTAITASGQTGSAKVAVYVLKPGENGTLFKNLAWGCPMWCQTGIANIYSFIPRNKTLKVFQRATNSSAAWEAVKPLSQSPDVYDSVYHIDGNDNLIVYGGDLGNVDVKIEYY